MKRKTLLILLISAILFAIIPIPVFAAEESVVGVPEYIADWGGEEYFFANGTAIIVEARTDGQQGALVKWKENGVEKSQLLGTVSNIFGGMHDNSIAVETSITINGGYVNWIHGGGLHKSNTISSKIVMNGGQVGHIKGGAADQWIPTSADCGCEPNERKWSEGDYENSPAQTGITNVIIKGGKIEKLSGEQGAVFGGGNGYANTDKANVNISGGDLSNAIVTAGGSHGNTTEANLNITGGTIKVVQTVNRGTIEEVSLKVTGGKITDLYIAGENAVDVTGEITGIVIAEVSGNAKVDKMQFGKNADKLVDVATSTVIKKENIKIASGTVKDASVLGENVTILNKVTIDGKTYLVEEGKTIKDIPEYNNIIKKDGYTFVEFKYAQGKWNENDALVDGIELTTVFKENSVAVEPDKGNDEVVKPEEKDETPNTGMEDMTLTVFAVIALISLAGIALIKRENK